MRLPPLASPLLLTCFLLAASSCAGDASSPDDDRTPEGSGSESASAEPGERVAAGQSGTEVPEICLEVSRVEVADLATPAAGFAFSVEEMLAAVAGGWSGTLELSGGGELDLELAIEPMAGPVFAVQTEWTEPHGDGPASGAPAMDCPDYYELPMQIAIDSGALLAEEFQVLAKGRAVADLEFAGTLDPAQVAGETAPTFDPAGYDSHSLSLYGSVIDASAEGFLMWNGINDSDVEQPDQEICEGDGFTGCVDPDTGECGACSGSAGKPSTVEPVGDFAATR